jgi:hypothetical protein
MKPFEGKRHIAPVTTRTQYGNARRKVATGRNGNEMANGVVRTFQEE